MGHARIDVDARLLRQLLGLHEEITIEAISVSEEEVVLRLYVSHPDLPASGTFDFAPLATVEESVDSCEHGAVVKRTTRLYLDGKTYAPWEMQIGFVDLPQAGSG